MNAFLRWMVTVVFTMTLVLPASAQTNQVLLGGVTQFAGGTITNVHRTVLHDDIVHYRFDVKVGPGQFDVIWLHRVVRERQPYEPVQTLDRVLLLPGSPNYFEAIFMAPLHSQVPGACRIARERKTSGMPIPRLGKMPNPWSGSRSWTGSSLIGDKGHIAAARSALAQLGDGADGLTGQSPD